MSNPLCSLQIVRDDSILHVVEGKSTFALLGLALGAIVAGRAIFNWTAHTTQPIQFDDFGHNAAMPFLIFAIGAAVWTRRDFQFDKASRVLAWRRDRLIGRRRGEVPFEDISDVTVEAFGRSGKAIRVVLQTTHGTITVTRASGLTAKKSCETIAARIREVLRNPKA